MKCPACWAEKAYRRKTDDLRSRLLGLVGLVAMRCHHCYHRFYVPWLLTIGKSTQPPPPAARGPHLPRYAPVSQREAALEPKASPYRRPIRAESRTA